MKKHGAERRQTTGALQDAARGSGNIPLHDLADLKFQLQEKLPSCQIFLDKHFFLELHLDP